MEKGESFRTETAIGSVFDDGPDLERTEIVHRKRLRWPPENRQRTLYITRYKVRVDPEFGDDISFYKCVGSLAMPVVDPYPRLPPDDIYARHLFRELERKGLRRFRPRCYLTDEWG